MPQVGWCAPPPGKDQQHEQAGRGHVSRGLGDGRDGEVTAFGSRGEAIAEGEVGVAQIARSSGGQKGRVESGGELQFVTRQEVLHGEERTCRVDAEPQGASGVVRSEVEEGRCGHIQIAEDLADASAATDGSAGERDD